MMDRRAFLAGMGAVLLAAPLAAEAQSASKVHRIGYLSYGMPVEAEKSPLVQGLRDLGWIEGQNIVIDRRFAASPEQLASMADELVRLKVEVIAVPSAGIAAIVRKATTTIPIVALAAGQLEGTGLVASLTRPGGNVTGIQLFSQELIGKRMQLLREAFPTLARVGVLSDTATTAQVASLGRRYVEETDAAGRALGLELTYITTQRVEELDSGFDRLVASRMQAVLIYGTPFMHEHRKRLAELALRHRLASTYETREFVEAGGLMSYGVNVPQIVRRGATFVDRILKGAKPADLPVERPTKFELVINLKTAKALGLTIPHSLLGRADEVIQ